MACGLSTTSPRFPPHRDGDGYISAADFHAVLEAAHLKSTEEDKAIMVKALPGSRVTSAAWAQGLPKLVACRVGGSSAC